MPVSLLRILLTLLLAAFLLAPAAAGAATGAGPAAGDAAAPPKPIELRTGWQFQFDPQNVGLREKWPDWSQKWTDVEVPHVFDPNPTDVNFLGTIGWYRLKFDTPATPAGFSWAFRFEGVRRAARVWLNGHRVGTSTDPYEQFTVPAAGLRTDGRPNELVVRVQNIRPKDLREGWWNWGGIVRPVTLMPIGRVEWRDLAVLSDVDCKPGATTCASIVRTDGWLINHTNETQDALLVLQLRAPSGALTSKVVTVRGLKPGEKRRVGFPAHIQGAPQLWSPVHPNLYDAYAEVRVGGEIQQVVQRRVGLRYIRVANGGQLYLNGHHLDLRGASIQEDLPGRGPALRDEDVEQIIADIKSLGANVTRAQYPLNERILERLDEEGILVWSQSPVYHADVQLATAAGRRDAYRKVRATVLYARNHPSVMTHSVANELTVWPDRTAGTKRFMLKAARITRDLDSTVPASLDLLSYPHIPKQKAYSGFGLLGLNSYYGWYKGKVTNHRSTARLSDLPKFLADMRRMYPRQAMLITEFGAEATFDGPPTVKETFAFQSRYVDRTLDIVDSTNWLSGAIYWTAREFYVKPDWDGGAERDVPRDALHNKGLITYDGKPKPAFYEAQRRFQSTPVYRP
jgi:beta-galactosidase/beta-glucuronidase